MGTQKLGDDNAYDVQGIVAVLFKLNKGSKLKLQEVKYVAKLKISLISMGTLEK